MLRFLATKTQRAVLAATASAAQNTNHVIGALSWSPIHRSQLFPAVARTPTSSHYCTTSSPHAVASADPACLCVRWNDAPDAPHDDFPLVWLRGHCQCPECFHPDTRSRRILGRQLRLEPKVTSCAVKDDHIHILWDDGHQSAYRNDWLKERSFRQPAKDPAQPKRQSWGATFSPKTFDFASTFSSDAAILEFLIEFKVHGICILKDAPKDAGECLAKAVFDFPLKTNYGEFFEVKNKPTPSNLAYTASELGLHNDLPFMERIPDIQVLHCILQTDDLEGGANTFSDASFVANRLRKENPQAFELLTTENATYWDIGSDAYGDFHMRWSRPVIRIDPNTGDFLEVAYNHQVLDSILNISQNRVQPWFEALVLLQNVLVEESIRWRLHTGEVVIFDNRRCLHGREGYRATSERHLRGCYFLMDHTESKLRVLHDRVHRSS